jgi:hypothetical protein
MCCVPAYCTCMVLIFLLFTQNFIRDNFSRANILLPSAFFFQLQKLLYRLDKLLLKQNKLPELRDNQFCFNIFVYYTYNHFTWTDDYRTTGILGLLIKFLTVYLCIRFHFFALALGGKGVFYSYKKIVMLHFCNWKKNALGSRMFALEKLWNGCKYNIQKY